MFRGYFNEAVRLFGSAAICGWIRCSLQLHMRHSGTHSVRHTMEHTQWDREWNTGRDTQRDTHETRALIHSVKYTVRHTVWHTTRYTGGTTNQLVSACQTLYVCKQMQSSVWNLQILHTRWRDTTNMWSTGRQGCIGHKWCVEFMVEMCIQTKVKSSSIDKWSVNNVPQTVAAGAAEPADVQLKLTMRTPRRCTLHQTLLCWHSPYCVVGGGDPP